MARKVFAPFNIILASVFALTVLAIIVQPAQTARAEGNSVAIQAYAKISTFQR